MINFTRMLPSGTVVKVFDTSGREMLHEVNPTQINVSSLENGYYILKIFENHELIFHKNIVIIK
ncbi:MAG: T9SS type A sorting domain-containing protein [Bacteroidetes bacterium]|nr:T9SS type A sorting domain-containing protein [Bacteroidota bacterium]